MADETPQPKVRIITSSPSALRTGDQTRRIVESGVPVDTLHKNFTAFMTGLRQMLTVDSAADATSAGVFQLDEITFTAEISVEGEFKLLGSGMGATATGGISFTLRRQPAKDVAVA
jgi:hypothetical protein